MKKTRMLRHGVQLPPSSPSLPPLVLCCWLLLALVADRLQIASSMEEGVAAQASAAAANRNRNRELRKLRRADQHMRMRRVSHPLPTRHPTSTPETARPTSSTPSPTISPSSAATTTTTANASVAETMPSTNTEDGSADKPSNVTGSITTDSITLDDNAGIGSDITGNATNHTAAIERPPTMAPPQYTARPLPPSCSRPPAWADDDLFWSDLSADQRKAALYLGYTSAAWDADDADDADELYAALAWSDLSPDQRLAFSYLGYNSGSYEDFYSDYYFHELPVEVQEAAAAVGYTEAVWDGCEAEVCAKVDDKFWKGLGRQERINMKVMGYDCWTWNNDDVNA